MTKNNSIMGINELVDIFGDFYKNAKDYVNEKTGELKNIRFSDSFGNLVPYKYNKENGLITIEAVIAGHSSKDIKARYNKVTNVIKIYDENDVPIDSRPWYYNELNLEFELPKTVHPETFVKSIENGVITISVQYSDENPDDYDKEFEIV